MARPVVVRIDGNVAGLERELRRIDGRLDSTGKAARRAGALLAGAFGGAAIARGAGIAISTAGKFDQAITNTGAVSGATAKQVAQLEAVSRKLGLGMGVGATQAAMAATELVKGGLAVQEVINGAEKAAIQLSLAGDVALPQAAESMASAMQIFKIAGKDATFIGDQYVNFANQTTGSVESIVMGMSSASAAGKNAWKELRGGLKEAASETVLSLAIMQRAGQNAQDAGTTVKTALNRFGTKPGQKALAKFDVDVYDAEGNLKNLTGITRELRKELGGLTGQQRTGAVQAIFGSDGGRLGQALLEQTPKQIDALRKAMSEQGTAQETAAKKAEGYVASMNALRAAREELLIVIGKPTADALAGISQDLAKQLGDPRTTKQLEELGDVLEGVVSGGVEALVDGLEDGTVQRHLAQIVDVAKGGAETLGHFASAGADVLEAIDKIPGSVLAAAAAFAVWRTASAALLAPLAGVAARGAAAVAAMRGGAAVGPVVAGAAGAGASSGAGVVGAARAGAAARAPRAFGPQMQTAAAAQRGVNQAMNAQLAAQAQARATAAALAASRGGRTYGGSVAAQQAQIRAAAAARAAEARTAAAQASAARVAREDTRRRIQVAQAEQQAARAQRRRTIAVRGAGGAAAAGIGVLATGGMDTKNAMIAAGAIGMMGGPMVAAGAALGAGAVSEITKYVKASGKKEFEQLGRDVANGMGRGNTAKERKTLTDLQDRINKGKPKVDYQYDPRRPGGVRKVENSQQYIDDNVRAGKLGAVGIKRKLGSAKFIDANDIVKETRAAFAGADPIAKKQAAATMTVWAKELEAKGKLSKGAAERVAKQFGVALGASSRVIEKEVKKADIQGALGAAVGNNKKQITKLLKDNAKMFTGIEKPAKTSYRNIVKIAESQLAVLATKMRSGTASQRKAAATEYQKLASSVRTYMSQASGAVKRFGTDGTAAITSLQAPIVALNGKMQSLAPTFENLAIQLGDLSIPEPGSAPKKPAKKKKKNGRRGGKFRGGGLVDIAVSPQELGILPDGRQFMVPGEPVAADSVGMSVPAGTEIYTGHGQELLAAGLSRQEALRSQMPHFAGGGKVTGKTSWFGGPNDASTRGRKTALGLSPNLPGVAIRPGATFQSGRPYLGGYWDVHVGGKNSVLRQIDLGPHERTGKRIDITSAALGGLGYNEKTFPTGATGWAAWLGKDRAAAVRRAAAGEKSGDLVSPIMVGASKRDREGMVADAYSQAFSRASSGVAADDLRRYKGLGLAGPMSEAVTAAQTTTRVAMSSSSLGGDTDGRVGKMQRWAASAVKKYPKYVYGGGHGKLGQGPYDCSGLASGIAGAGNFLSTPLDTTRFEKFGVSGKGKQITFGIRGSSGKNAHMMSKVGGRYFEAGGGGNNGSVGERSGWNGTFTTFRHPKGYRQGGRVPAAVARAVKRPDAFNPSSPNFVGYGFGGGGTVKSRRVDQTIPSAGLLIAMVSGSARDYVPQIDAQLASMTQARVEKLRREIQRAANSSGSKATVNRARSALSVLDDELGERAGTAVFRSSRFLDARSAAATHLSQVQRVNGTVGTAKALRDQQAAEQRFIAGAPGARAGLEQQIRAADRAKDYEASRALREALIQLNNETQEAAANVADLGREAEAAAESERQAVLEKRAVERGAGMRPLDLAQAEATLTKTLDDDAAVQVKRVAEATSALAVTRADAEAGLATTEDIIAAITALTAETERGNAIAEEQKAVAEAAAAEAKASTESILELERQKNENLKRDLAAAAVDLPKIINGLANAGIGSGANRLQGLPNRTPMSGRR